MFIPGDTKNPYDDPPSRHHSSTILSQKPLILRACHWHASPEQGY